MRIAQLNDCTVCLAFRADKVRAQGLDEDFYCAVGSLDDSALTEEERLAVEYADLFATDHTRIDDAFVERLRGSFTMRRSSTSPSACPHSWGWAGPSRAGISETSLTDV